MDQVTPSGNDLVRMLTGSGERLASARDIAGVVGGVSLSATDYTFRMRDAGGLILTTSSSAVSLTVPPASVTPFLLRTRISVAQMGSGQVTFVAGAGVTIRSPETLKISKQYGVATLILVDSDAWLLVGYLEAAA